MRSSDGCHAIARRDWMQLGMGFLIGSGTAGLTGCELGPNQKPSEAPVSEEPVSEASVSEAGLAAESVPKDGGTRREHDGRRLEHVAGSLLGAVAGRSCQ